MNMYYGVKAVFVRLFLGGAAYLKFIKVYITFQAFQVVSLVIVSYFVLELILRLYAWGWVLLIFIFLDMLVPKSILKSIP